MSTGFTRMKYILILNLLILVANGQTPVNNPVSDHYNTSSGYPSWTDNIKWANVINMGTYSNGANAFAKFENARDQLHAQGGGVLYYPAGTYDFSAAPADGPTGRGLMLKSGVVIRGEKPSGDKDATDGTITLPTKFVFKFNTRAGGQVPRDWNLIGIAPSGGEQLKDVNNVGIAWVHVVGAAVYFGPQMTWGATWGTAGSWLSGFAKTAWKSRVPNGQHPMDPFAGGGNTFVGAGKGRLVFGCLFEDAAVMNDALDYGFGPSGFYTYKFGARIGVYGSEVFIANNSIPKSSKNFKYTQKTCDTNQSSGCSKGCNSVADATIIFDYGKNTGIDVNKELLGLAGTENAGYYQEGVMVQDNFVYNHGHKGFNISGKYVIIRNNRNERNYLKESADIYVLGTGWRLTLDGYIRSTAGGPGCISDNLARAFDISGQAVWIDNNKYNNTGSDPGNDGEGILAQAHGGTQIYSWAITNNVHTKGTGESGYIGGYDVQQNGILIAWNTTAGWVGSTKAGANIDAAYVSNTAAGGTSTTGTDVLTACPTGSLTAPTNLVAKAGSSGNYVEITWSDASNQEIGFRIDRKIGTTGSWTKIVYRPRKSAGTSYNEQKWLDFNAPKNAELFYRVVAINCADTDAGASTTSGKVVLGSVPPSGNTVTLIPVADAYVRDGSYAAINYGSNAELAVKKSSSGYNRETFLKFDLSTISGSVNSVKLRLYGNLNDNQGTNVPSAVFSSGNTSWTESGILWSNKPIASSTSLSTATVANATPTWYEWDVTSFVAAEKSAGRNLVTLVLKNPSTSTPYTSFNSKEGTNKPELVVTTGNSSSRIAFDNSEVNAFDFSNVEVYPNPAREHFTLSFNHSHLSEVKAELVNLSGDAVWRRSFMARKGKNNLVISTSGLLPGLYIMSLKGIHSGRATLKKVIVQ